MSPIKIHRLILPLLIIGVLLFLALSYYFLGPRPYRKQKNILGLGPDGVINILLIGKDARALNPALDRGGANRIPREKVAHSDIVIICHINLNHNRVNLLAIPRDLLVAVPGVTIAASPTDFNAMEKITHSYAIGGEKLLRRTLENFLGIKIHRFIAFDFDSFRMTFRLLRSFLGPLDLGPVKLSNPDQALKFVRRRNGLTYDDLDRCRNSLKLIKIVATRLWRFANTRLADIILERIFSILGTDTDLPLAETRQLISQLHQQKFTPERIQTAVLVSEGKPVTLDRYTTTLSCYLPIYPEIEKQIDYYLKDNESIPALSFMTQQPYPAPAYLNHNYELLPDYRTDTLERQRIVKRLLNLPALPPQSN
ncbi:MAG: LCP family protein [bacterium]